MFSQAPEDVGQERSLIKRIEDLENKNTELEAKNQELQQKLDLANAEIEKQKRIEEIDTGFVISPIVQQLTKDMQRPDYKGRDPRAHYRGGG